MIVENVFDYKIARVICKDVSVYKDEDLIRSVNDVLTMESITNTPIKNNNRYQDPGDSRVGKATTSVAQPYIDLVYLPGASKIVQWITDQFLLASDMFFPSVKKNNIVFRRSWINQLNEGGYGKCHAHVKEIVNGVNKPDLVGIFYLEVPENSAPLIFVNNGVSDYEYTQFLERDMHYVYPKIGELVIHPSEVLHAVGLHQSDLRRICFVFEADID
jgi:hypothetical protein